MTLLTDIDALIARDGAFAPRWGWHDDHREADGTPAYLPALQQVRSEYAALLDVLANELGLRLITSGCSCLQLGLGECNASHEAWRHVFKSVVTLDWGKVLSDDSEYAGVEVSDVGSAKFASELIGPGGYDFLFIDAGHSAEDARRDHANYGPLVRPGGIIAFHDALRRPGFEEAVQVWRYLAELREPVNMIGTEVGVAWLRQA